MKRTAIYIRVSTDEQAKEGDSIPAQREALRKYIDEHEELALADEYVDEGISGRKFQQRDELQRLLDDVRAGKIDLIAFTKLDRWFRSVRHYSSTQDLLDKYHVDWIAIWEPMFGTATPSGRLVVNQMMSIAQYEAENTGSRIRQVFEYKVQQGEVLSGHIPRGYVIQNKHLVPGPDADVIIDLFNFFSKSGSIYRTTKHFQQLTGESLCYSSIKTILKNRKYIGEFRGNPNYCPPLVPRELFFDCQRKLSMNVKTSAKYQYIFSGLFVCAECGRRFGALKVKHTLKSGITHSPAYRCMRHYGGYTKDCPNSKIVYEKTMEKYLLENIAELATAFKIEYRERQKDSREAQKNVDTLNRKLERLKELYLNELIDISEYKKRREEYLEQISALKAPAHAEPRDFSELDKLSGIDLKTVYGTLNNAEKRYLWRSVIKEIRVTKDRQISIIFL